MRNASKNEDSEEEEEEEKSKTWKDWLKEPVFYVFGAVYMMSRVAINVTMTMQPFYLV
jgi:hypothetical protein